MTRTTHRVRTCLLAGILFVTSAQARSEVDLAGRWAGVADLWGRPVLIEMDLTALGGTLDAYGEAPLSFDARVLAGAEISGIEAAGSAVRLDLQAGNARYVFRGHLIGDVLAGNLEGEGAGASLRALRVPRVAASELEGLVGLYERAGERLVVTWREYGGLRAVDLATGTGDTLIPVGARAFLSRRQILDADTAQPAHRFPRGPSGEIVALVRGPWREPTTFERSRALSQEQLRFRSGEVELAGTLLLPPSDRPVPAVVLVHGSGPIYRTALLERATLFVDSGLAAFIYDKRGTGASGGERRGDPFETLVEDIHAAVGAVRRYRAVDGSRVGLQGHSQAGFLIPVVAAADPDLAFAIVVNGGGIRPGEQSLFDKENDLIREGFAEPERQEALSLMRRMYAYVRDRVGDRAELERMYLAARSKPWFPVTDLPELPAIPSWQDPPPEMLAYAAELLFDPIPYQRRMHQPVLVLLAERDQTVPAARVVEAWRASLRAHAHPAVRIEIVPGADHGMRLVNGEGAGRLSPDYGRIQREWLAGLFAPAPAPAPAPGASVAP